MREAKAAAAKNRSRGGRKKKHHRRTRAKDAGAAGEEADPYRLTGSSAPRRRRCGSEVMLDGALRQLRPHAPLESKARRGRNPLRHLDISVGPQLTATTAVRIKEKKEEKMRL
jgi:hypothetical protein